MSRRRFVLLWLAPVLLLVGLRVAPLAGGGETLFLRDVFNTHLPMKHAQAEALRAGYLPLVDPARAGGQPAAGNLNSVPFYPDNLLHLVAPLLWVHNAHFWLHWLLAPLSMAALALALGLDRRAAWAAGVCYALSGYFASQMSFYNLVAGVALAPGFAAALVIAVADGPARRRALALGAAGVGWALLLTAGDPLTAALALGLGLTAPFARPAGRRPAPRRLLAPVVALAAGTLVALPQLVELARILPLSFRGYQGYSRALRTVASFDPRQALEWLLPFAFGRPDTLGAGRFWGHPFFTDSQPYYFTLYPGLLALALVAAAGRPRGVAAARWAWGAVGGGLFFALGRFNPLAAWLFGLSPAESLRYPIKFWLPVAVGASLLAGLGFERAGLAGDAAGATPAGAGRRLLRPLAGLTLLYAAGWGFATFAPGTAEALLRSLVPARFPDAFVANERLRWAGLALLAALVGLALVGLLRLSRRWRWAAPALLAVHAAAQLFFLAPALATDEAEPYRRPSPLLAAVPPEAPAVHGAFGELFGPSTLGRGDYPDRGARWLERRAFADLYPFAGALWGRRFVLDVSPEGLDSYFTRLARAAVEEAGDDRRRLALLRAWGVERLLLDRDIGAEARPLVRLVAEQASFGRTTRVYAVEGAAPEVLLATRVLPAPHMNAALWALASDAFDPADSVVVAGDGPARGVAGGGAVRLVARGPESLEAEVTAPVPGVLVWQRAWLPIYRARVDGHEAPPQVANLHRLGVEVPAGEHRVRIWADRRPLTRAAWGSLAGLLLLAAVAVSAFRFDRGR